MSELYMWEILHQDDDEITKLMKVQHGNVICVLSKSRNVNLVFTPSYDVDDIVKKEKEKAFQAGIQFERASKHEHLKS